MTLRAVFATMAFAPIAAIAQISEINGVWRLREKESIAGANYDNGVPKFLVINIQDSLATIKYPTTTEEGDTVIEEILKVGAANTNEIITSKRKIKQVVFSYDNSNKEWIRKSTSRLIDAVSNNKIVTLDVFQRSSTDSNELILRRDLQKSDPNVKHESFSMMGFYIKTTAEQLANDTATGRGVTFSKEYKWTEILKISKKDNKLVFIDCYATWCLPCKKMDKEVFTLNRIGSLMNDKFISIKLQMDSSRNDDQYIKRKYPLAAKFEKDYKIEVLPTYLVFDSEGNPVHKASGALSADLFYQFLQDAQNPSKQIFTILRKYERGQVKDNEIAELALLLENKGEKTLSGLIARKYFERYLYKLPTRKFFTEEHLSFYNSFSRVIKPDDLVFRRIVKSPILSDSLANVREGFSKSIIRSVITNSEIIPFLDNARNSPHEPDWAKLENNLKTKYPPGQYFSCLVGSKANWYMRNQKWDKYVANLILYVESTSDTKVQWLALNSAAWEIFLHSDDSLQLAKALAWSELAINEHIRDTTVQNRPWAGILDTYANILFKMGRKEQAIAFYQKNILTLGALSPSLYENYLNIFKGIPTWRKEEK